MPKLLSIDDCPHVQLYRTIVQIIEDDQTVRRIVRPSSMRSWQGIPIDAAQFGEGAAPALRFTPTQGNDAWWTPGSMRGNLFIEVEIFTKGTCADDPANLWWIIRRALYPSDNAARMTIQGKMQTAYMLTLPTFSRLNYTEITTTHFHCAAQIAVNVREDIN